MVNWQSIGEADGDKPLTEMPCRKDVLVLRLIDSPYTPQFVLLFLMIVPYLVYDRSVYERVGLFLVNPLFSTTEHITVAIALMVVVLGGTFFGVLLSRSLGGYWRDGPASTIYFGPLAKSLVLLPLTISVIAHLYLLATSGQAYASGGLLDARAQIANGVGIFLRLYMFSLPLMFLVFRTPKFGWAAVILMGLLICGQLYIISERMAIFEFVATMVPILMVRRTKVKLIYIVGAAVLIYLAFSALVQIRLTQQNSANRELVERGASRTDLSTIAYYADTMNKAYYAALTSVSRDRQNWSNPIRVLTGGEFFDTAYYESVVSSGTASPELNNPGGFAEDVEDAGFLGAFVILWLKTLISTVILSRARISLLCYGLLPIFYIRVLEYPRFEYLYLPYAFIVLLVALIFLLILPAVSYRLKT